MLSPFFVHSRETWTNRFDQYLLFLDFFNPWMHRFDRVVLVHVSGPILAILRIHKRVASDTLTLAEELPWSELSA